MPYKILIIGEDRGNLKLYSEILSLNGYEPLEAKSVFDGIRLAMSEKPHLILLDIEVTDLKEIEMSKIMKSEPSIRDIPVIVLYPFATKWTRKRFLELGFADCIAKPFGIHEFRRIINKHLPKGRR
ncbi:MAG: response regulator [Nitrospirota bacterium]